MALAVLLGAGGCGRKETASPKAEATTNYDACALLTKEEVQATQASAVTEAKSSVQKDSVFRISQCYYVTAEFNRSVSLAVTRNLGPGQRSPKDFWEERFGSDKKEEREGGEDAKRAGSPARGGEEEGEAQVKPRKVEGVGDAAYWTGDRLGGALYVLKKDAFIRLSVGGRDDEEGKIEKTKKLAELVLSRF